MLCGMTQPQAGLLAPDFDPAKHKVARMRELIAQLAVYAQGISDYCEDIMAAGGKEDAEAQLDAWDKMSRVVARMAPDARHLFVIQSLAATSPTKPTA